MCISRLEMYIFRLEMCISSLEIEFSSGLENFFSLFSIPRIAGFAKHSPSLFAIATTFRRGKSYRTDSFFALSGEKMARDRGYVRLYSYLCTLLTE